MKFREYNMPNIIEQIRTSDVGTAETLANSYVYVPSDLTFFVTDLSQLMLQIQDFLTLAKNGTYSEPQFFSARDSVRLAMIPHGMLNSKVTNDIYKSSYASIRNLMTQVLSPSIMPQTSEIGIWYDAICQVVVEKGVALSNAISGTIKAVFSFAEWYKKNKTLINIVVIGSISIVVAGSAYVILK